MRGQSQVVGNAAAAVVGGKGSQHHGMKSGFKLSANAVNQLHV